MLLPSFKMAIIRTMKGAKSNFHMRAINKKPNCQVGNKEKKCIC